MKKFDSLEDTLSHLKNIVDKTIELSIPELSSEFLHDCEPYLPFVTGDLQRSGITWSDFNKGHIEWRTPYARRLFYNPQYNFSTDAHPLAQGLWGEKVKEVNKNKYLQLTTEQFEKAKKDAK